MFVSRTLTWAALSLALSVVFLGTTFTTLQTFVESYSTTHDPLLLAKDSSDLLESDVEATHQNHHELSRRSTREEIEALEKQIAELKASLNNNNSTSAGVGVAAQDDATVCIRSNKKLLDCATSWWLSALQTTAMSQEGIRNYRLEAKKRHTACAHEKPPVIGRQRRRRDLDDIQSRYIFEFYGDSTLRQMWERFIKAVGAHRGGDTKSMVSMNQRGPVYAHHPVVVSDEVIYSNHRGSEKARTTGSASQRDVCSLFARDNVVLKHRSSFRFDYTAEDLANPALATDNSSIKRIPEEFLLTSGDASSFTSHHAATNNDRHKVIFFSFGVHPATFLAATGGPSSTRLSSYEGTLFDASRGDELMANSTKLREIVRSTFEKPIFEWMRFFATRRRLRLLAFVQSFVECNAMRDPAIKKNNYLRQLSPRCDVINKAIPLISEIITDVFTLGRPHAAVPAWVTKRLENDISEPEERDRLRGAMRRAVYFRGFHCGKLNSDCTSQKCYCTKEGIHFGLTLSVFSVSEALALVVKMDRCLKSYCGISGVS